ncbi:MAG: hypothetical protein QM658_11035 [Gordonia sp. (in: high G+C Gram-positive bacteria)]
MRPVLAVLLLTLGVPLLLTGAAVSDSSVVRGLLAGLAVFGTLVGAAGVRRNAPSAGLVALFLAPLLLVSVALPVVAVWDATRDGSRPWSAGDRSHSSDDELSEVPADPSAQLSAALDKADQLVPNGSATVLAVSLRDSNVNVNVFDPRTGQEHTSSLSSGKWYDAPARRANDRHTFSRAEVSGMDLTKARPEVLAVAKELNFTGRTPHASNGIEVKRRYQDQKLVAAFGVSGDYVQVDQHGEVAPTVSAAKLDTMLALALQLARDNGVNTAAKNVESLDFATPGGGTASIIGAFAPNSGGFAIDFVNAPVRKIEVVPGQFPLVDTSVYKSSTPAFVLSSISDGVLTEIRDDIIRRKKVPGYDTGTISVSIGSAPFEREHGPMIRMAVGPREPGAGGAYTLDGTLIHDGTEAP